MDYNRYPANWKSEIVPAMHARAGGRCEWVEWIAGEWVRCPKMHRDPRPGSAKGVTLTTAHVGAPWPGHHGDKHDKADVRDENLLLLCEAHHLALDLEDHIKHARATRADKKRATMTRLYTASLFNEAV